MASEWSETTLGEFVRLQRGHDLTAEERKLGDYPVMGSAGPNGTHGEFIAHGPGVVIGRSGASMGKVHFMPNDYWPHNTCLYVTDFLGNDPRFAFYLLGSLDLASYNSGSAQPSLNRNYIYTKPIRFPPLEEQRAIAETLGSLDDRIDNLRQTNGTLEAVAAALFKSWFVDFDGVDDERRAYTFGEIATLGKGSVTPTTQPHTVFQHYSLPAFDAGQMPIAEIGEAIKSNKTPVPSGAVLVSKLNPHIPRIWFVGDVGDNAVCSTEFLVWTPKPGIGSAFVYFVAASPGFNDTMRQLVTGTSNSHQRVRPEQLAQARAAIASETTIAAFDETATPLLRKIEYNRQQADALAALRDTLLPHLISGQLRVKQ